MNCFGGKVQKKEMADDLNVPICTNFFPKPCDYLSERTKSCNGLKEKYSGSISHNGG